MHLPQRAADFTPAWLTEAMRSGGGPAGVAVTSVATQPLGMSTGLTSDLLRIVPSYEGAPPGPATLIAKMSSEDEVTAALGSSLRLFDREVHFYKELAGEAGVTVPRVYFADSEPDTGRYVLLLEDLGRVGDQNPPHDCTVPEAELVVAALAAMHANWWESDRLKKLPWLMSGTSRNYTYAVQRKYQQAWPGIAERFGTKFPRGVIEIGEALAPRVSRAYDRASVQPVTLTHGWLWPQNIYLRGDPASPEVTFISWQTVGLRPGPWDLAFFLATGLPVEARRANEMRLLRRYHDLLLGRGVRDYPFDRVIGEYRNGLLRLLIMIAIADDNLDLSTPAGQGLVERYADRSVALRDWKCGDYLPL